MTEELSLFIHLFNLFLLLIYFDDVSQPQWLLALVRLLCIFRENSSCNQLPCFFFRRDGEASS